MIRPRLVVAFLVVVVIATVAVTLLLRRQPLLPGDAPTTSIAERTAAPVAVATAPSEAVAPPATHAVPVTPVYGPLVDTPAPVETPPPIARRSPAGPAAIYRCGSRGSVTYSNEPCPNGTVVDGSSAVSGYETRPSDRLARLVADGRADSTFPEPNLPDRRQQRPQSAECANLRRQVRDLDATATLPQHPAVLDEILATRRDVRTSMTRLRC